MKWILLALSTVCLIGCGAREDIVVSKLDVKQNHWDSLEVNVDFAQRAVFSRVHPVSVDSLYIVAFNASYDTIYAGNDSIFYIADANLGNRERILLEVCGHVELIQVCEQTGIEASPKRIQIEPEFAYPYKNRFYQGSYKLPFIVERQAFGIEQEGAWEKVTRTNPIQGFIRAFVTGKEDESVHFPFTKRQDAFNLTHHSNYKDFKYYIDSALLDYNEANVQFDIFVDIAGFSDVIGSVTREIALKTAEEQQVDVANFAKLAAEQLVDLLSPYHEDRRNVVYINSWNYNRFKRMYLVDMEIEWEGSLFTRNKYIIAGKLEVYENDLRSSFRMTDTNRRAQRLWDRTADGPVLPLKPLDTFKKDEPVRGSISESHVFTFSDNVVLIEAEEYKTTRSANNLSWRLEQDHPGFNGGGAVVVRPDRGLRIRNGFRRESPSLEYKIMLPERGTYYVWLRSWARDNNSNSVHMGINGNEVSTLQGIEVDEYNEWTWTRELISERGHARFSVRSPGIHTLNLWMREDGTYVDQILITRDRNLRPRDVMNP